MMVERFASLVELFAYSGSMDSFFQELKRSMIACFDGRFIAFHHGRMLSSMVEPLRLTTVEWFALRRIYFFNGRIIASDDGRMRKGNK